MKSSIFLRSLILFTLSAIFFCSCEKFLDREPISSLTKENMWKTTREVQAGINDIYFQFRNTMRSNYFYWGEVRGDNFEVKTPGTSEMDKVVGNVMTSDMNVTLWTNLYKTINSANAAIKYIPDSEVTTETLKKDYLAQAYAMRALCYLYAVRIWGDVPVYLVPTEDMATLVLSPRVPMTDVLNNVIIPDLLQAEANINTSNRERKRISKFGIYAIMADAYMWLEDYDNVIATVDKFISIVTSMNNRPYDIATSMADLTYILTTELQKKASNDNSESDAYGNAKELLFVIHFDQEEWATSSWLWTLFGGGEGAGGTLRLTEDFISLFSIASRGGDQRATYFVKNLGMSKYIPYGSTVAYTIWSECEMAYPVYRSTELYFMKAEALARQDKWSEALTIVKENFLKRAASTATSPIYVQAKTQSDFYNVEDVIDYILEEKRIELVGEGKRWFDLVRTGRWKNLEKYKRADENGNVSVPEYQKLFPIHSRHINENPGNITQNPGY